MERSNNLQLFKQLYNFIKPFKVRFFITATLSVLIAFLALFRPIIIKQIIDVYIQQSESEGLFYFTILLVGLLILETLALYFFTYLSSYIAQNVIQTIRLAIFNKILSYKLRYFDTNPIGKLVTRTVSDVETIAEMISQGMLSIVGDIFKLLVILIYMFYTNADLALVVLIPMPILILSTNIFRKVIKKTFQDIRNRVSELNTFVQEHITGMSIIQIFNKERDEMEKFEKINTQHKNAYMTTINAFSIFFALVDILSAASIALLMWYGFSEITQSLATPGEIFSYILFVHILFRPIRQMADKFNVLQMGFVSSNRVFKILNTENVISDKGSLNMNNAKGNVNFKNVWFAYKEQEWVLKDISFNLQAGKTLAIVGPTGAGKSSLINILGRFYEYNKGCISIDDYELSSIDLKSLRSHLSIVLQEGFLFSDTVYNNVMFYDKSITKEEVIAAAKKIGVHEFISQLPGDYNYNVKERGVLLSTGQKQLLSFLRAYVHNPNILILDEATSSIDSESEKMIQHATDVITKNRTSIIIAHRLSTIKNADSILVVDKGRIIEQGSHDQLIAIAGGAYKKLYENQFKVSD